MPLTLAQVAIVVRDYDEAIRFYVDTLGFTLIEDTPVPAQDKRWVVVAPSPASACRVLLARAATPEQESRETFSVSESCCVTSTG